MYREKKVVIAIVITKGRLCDMGWRKGGPMERTMEERMYWKVERRKRVVFWELRTEDLSVESLGGMYLWECLATSRRVSGDM